MNDDLDNLKIFLDWYITMLCLNANIDPIKTNSHPINYQSLEEFKIAKDWSDPSQNKMERWKRTHKL